MSDPILDALRARLAAVEAEKARIEAAIVALEGRAPSVRAATAQELLEVAALEGKAPPVAKIEPQWIQPWWPYAPCHGYGCNCFSCQLSKMKTQPAIIGPGAPLCTCGQAWFGITPPPPCHVHTYVVTTTLLPFITCDNGN